ncbi:alpha/beta hydrolase [Bythopirellula polymerisocia]|nr:alpha/beta hydrolase [Bythopirellula polymerisocia]
MNEHDNSLIYSLRLSCKSLVTAALALFLLLGRDALAAPPIAPPPAPPVADEILLISTRQMGTTCDPNRMEREMDCRRLTFDADGLPTWMTYDWHNLQNPSTGTRKTVIYVHGNRVELGNDVAEGMAVYESLVGARRSGEPLRYIIWSWPSEQIPGLIKDYKVKAKRTNEVAWQLAWFVDQLPADMPLALMGYSYGARTVSGTMHLLGGGHLNELRFTSRRHPERSPARVALVAAAFDADWVVPGEVHERALTQIEQMVVVTNRLDPAMRFFRLSTKHSRVDAMGLAGVDHREKLGTALNRIRTIDVTHEVGRSHVIYDYLADEPKMTSMWRQLLEDSGDSQSDTIIPAYAHIRPHTELK